MFYSNNAVRTVLKTDALLIFQKAFLTSIKHSSNVVKSANSTSFNLSKDFHRHFTIKKIITTILKLSLKLQALGVINISVHCNLTNANLP